MIFAHHEMLMPAAAASGSLVPLLVLGARVKLRELRRWIRRR